MLKRYWRPYTPGPPPNLVTEAPSAPVTVTEVPLEQAEHPQTIFSEGELYCLFDSHDERIHSYEDILVNDAIDSTLEGIRHGVLPSSPGIGNYDLEPVCAGTKRVRSEKDEDAEPFLHTNTTNIKSKQNTLSLLEKNKKYRTQYLAPMHRF